MTPSDVGWDEGESLAERIFGPVIRFVWVNVLRRKSGPRTVHLAAADLAIGVDFGSVVVSRGLRTDAPLADQVQQIKQEADQAARAAAAAQAAADRALAVIERTREYVDRQDVAVQDSLRESSRRQAVDGVPVAVVGLVFTALGTLVQYVAGFLG